MSSRPDPDKPTPTAGHPGRRAAARGAIALAAAAVALLVAPLVALPTAEAQGRGKSKKDRGTFEHGCRVQPAQDFLKRRSFVKSRIVDSAKHQRALRWLVDRYGHADTDVTRGMSSEPAAAQAKTVKFMGLPISVHAKIAPALKCVEKRIRATCGKRSYAPLAIGGFRSQNSYRGMEVSNHLFGIAVDLDPDRNPCCGCVDPWPQSPLCKGEVSSVYERAALPRCWIRAFERFGFDWLGRDELEDTMHFEFLGDPDRIRR